jgi:hypothetical protein
MREAVGREPRMRREEVIGSHGVFDILSFHVACNIIFQGHNHVDAGIGRS